jgi:predicted solute-binding protein
LAIASVGYPACQPYRLLEGLSFARFEENDPVENRRRLHEGEVDIALIPASEFAIHGGYVGLDFGFGCHQRSSLILCANEPIERLNTIYLYEGSCCSAHLLRVLLREKWRVSPRLVRVQGTLAPHELRPSEGVLVRAEATHAAVQGFDVRHDLVTEWYSLTKAPFVFLIWAMRPGVLSMKQHQLFNDACHRAAAARNVLSAPIATPLSEQEQVYAKFVRERHFFYLDEGEIAGYREFCHRANKLNLLPQTDYRKATFSLLSRKPTDEVKLRGVGELLQDVVSGRRLSIREGIRLAHRASLPDLGLAADLLRVGAVSERRVTKIFTPSADEISRYLLGSDSIHEVFPVLVEEPPNFIRLPLLGETGVTLAGYEQLLLRLRSECILPIEGLSVGEIRRLALRESLAADAVISRLVTAGLTGIRGDGGGMLIDRLLSKHHAAVNFSAADWINTVKWVHRFGARSVCSLTLSSLETWEDRLVHLQKLRSLQDENPGFAYFSFDFVTGKRRALDPESKLRAILLGRLFLDNVPVVQVDERELRSTATLVSASLGSCDVELVFGSADRSRIVEKVSFLRSFSGLGMPLELAAPVPARDAVPPLH